jgi:hypothetical protein
MLIANTRLILASKSGLFSDTMYRYKPRGTITGQVGLASTTSRYPVQIQGWELSILAEIIVFSDMTLYALVDVSDEYAASIFGVEDIFF